MEVLSYIITPVHADDGTLLTNKPHNLMHWAVQYSQLLRRPSIIDEQAVHEILKKLVILPFDNQ